MIRLNYGLGCKRLHAAQETAREFGVSAQAIAEILGAAQRRLAREELTSRPLREAARVQAAIAATVPTPGNTGRRFRLGGHSHRRL